MAIGQVNREADTPRVLRECRKRRICVFITGLRPRCRLASGPTAAISCFIHALPRSEGDADVAAIRCLSPLVQSIGHHGAYGCQGSMAGTDNFALASFRIGPHGDFRIYVGYLATASSTATGPWRRRYAFLQLFSAATTVLCRRQPPVVAATRCRSPKRMLMSQPFVAAAHDCNL